MTIPTLNTTDSAIFRPIIQPLVSQTVSFATQIKNDALNYINTLQTSNVSADSVLSLMQNVARAVNRFNLITAGAAPADFDAGARVLIAGYSGSLSADIATTVAALQAVNTWILTNVPQSGGFVLAYTWHADGTVTPRSFTPAQTVGLVGVIQNVVNTIG